LPGLLAVCAAAALVIGGPLTPPAGPVASSYKTLAEIEPRIAINATNTPGDVDSVFRITQPGSYYLTENFTVPSGKAGIEVSSHNVNIDLGGFVISGTAGSYRGVWTTSTYDSVRVRNGTVQGLGSHGVDLYSSHGGGIENVHARGCGGYGISSNNGGYLRSCSATGCATAGFHVYVNTVAESCNAVNNQGMGFDVPYGATLSHCRADSNAGDGFNGDTASLDHCVASGNGGDGFWFDTATVIAECQSRWNTQVGIRTGTNCTVRECLVAGNTQQGIYVDTSCSVMRNQVRDNGGITYAGIWLSGMQNRAEENECTDNAYGLFISGSYNFAARNTCRNNSQGNFNAYNASLQEVAPIVTNPGPNGFAGATPWSNFAY
jgi:parallel beta-helix repeat protein